MSLLTRLEARFGRLAVPDLMTYLVAGQVAIYVVHVLRIGAGPGGDILDLIWLSPERVLAGEVWRLVTFLFQPPEVHFIFLFFYWYLLYFFGNTLEQQWGTFQFNLYLLVGWVATAGVSFLVPPGSVTNAYLYTSVFLAFAHLYPDFELQLYFLLPVKVKWLALLTWLGFAFSIYHGGWPQFWIAAATVADYLLFLGGSTWRRARHKWRGHRFQQRVVAGKAQHAALVHECRVCGLTSKMAPRAQFRYCSQCDGECCYCTEHVHNHEHVREKATATSDAGLN